MNITDPYVRDFDKIFAKHEATLCKATVGLAKPQEVTTLDWRQPDNCIYAIRYVLIGGTLMVYGDCFEAIYQWGGKIDFGFISRCDFGYFAEKCRASPSGRGFPAWDSDLAEETIVEYCHDMLVAHTEDGQGTKQYLEFIEKLNDSLVWDHIDSSDAWTVWCHSDAYDVLGDDWYEGSIAEPGKMTDVMCLYHLEGVKHAMAQLEEGKKDVPDTL